MAQLRTLTVNLVDLNLQTDVINGASVEISLERTATSDSFAIVPTLSYSKTSDATGILTFRILPNNDYTRYRAKVVATSGQQVLDAFFVMPDGNRALATLLQLSVYPDGFNNTVVTTGYATQFQVNGEDVGTPDLVETLNIDMPGATKTDPDITGMASVHLPYSGQYRGTWDMSSGTSGPAAPVTDYQSTHTATTVTPSATLTGSGPKYLAASSSPLIPLLSSGIASATLTQPDYAAGDTIYATTLLITNSSATASDIESLFSGSPPSGLYLAYIALSPYAAAAALGSVNDGTPSSESGASAAAGVVVHATIDYATGVVSAAVGSDPVFGTTNLDLAAIAAKGDGLRLWAGVLSTSSSVVFGAGHITLSFSGFTALTDATLPDGALDNDWYEVSAGGYFHGKTTRAGQFVKLISGKTNLIVVDTPADPGTSSLESVTVTHFSDINTTGVTDPRLYVVTADETNANQRTQYLFDGSALMWLVALEA